MTSMKPTTDPILPDRYPPATKEVVLELYRQDFDFLEFGSVLPTRAGPSPLAQAFKAAWRVCLLPISLILAARSSNHGESYAK